MNVDEFLHIPGQILDVRSPKEFAHARILDAINIALFSDEERAQVGTTYKKVGKDQAVLQGIDLVSPKLSTIYKQVQQTSGLKKIYCWRGGMRSGFLCAFLQSLGIKSIQLEGGYKAFRKKMLQCLDHIPQLYVLGGLTGSGKTEMLQALAKAGHAVLDLEALARHRGSVFGQLAIAQPSNEQFENDIGYILYKQKGPIWVEDESRLIGSCKIPNSLYLAMQNAPLFILKCPLEERIARIDSLYGSFSKEWWIEKTLKLQRRLGSECTHDVCQAVEQNRLCDAIKRLLNYYDRAYHYALSKHQGPVQEFNLNV